MARTIPGAAALCGLAALFLAAQTGPAHAAIKTQTVDYTIGDAPFEGYLAYDDAKKGKRPGVVVFSAWSGISDNERAHAQRLAKLGYVVFVADTYGKGVHPTQPKDAAAEAGKYMRNRNLYRERSRAALDQLRGNPMVDPARIAAIGYCFGGMGALELARSGADVKAVVVFHANLNSPNPQDAKNIKGRVLALQGADDPNVTAAERANFENEMRDARVDWQLVAYGGTVHCFTDPKVGNDPSKGCAYNAELEQRSWVAMLDLFRETIAR